MTKIIVIGSKSKVKVSRNRPRCP